MNDYALESLIQQLLAWENTIGSKCEIKIAKDLMKRAATALEEQEKKIEQLRYLEEEWSESRHNKELIRALDSGFDKGYREAMNEIISIARDIKEEHKEDE